MRSPGTDLYCFPHAGGGASTFLPWRAIATARLRVHPVHYGAVDDRSTIAGIAATVTERLRPTRSDVAFLGHSMGALVAFETIRELRRLGLPEPHTLVVAAHPAPHLRATDAPVHRLPTKDFWAAVRRQGGTSDEVLDNSELRGLTEPSLRAAFAACETYRYTPSPPLCADILGYAGTDDDEASAAQMRPWAIHTVGTFTLHERPGGHFFPHDDPASFLTELAAYVGTGPRTRRWSA